jgi:DNA-binding transcriptional regulator YdaS (Cro superfamily)
MKQRKPTAAIRKAIDIAGSQAKLAERAGCAQQTISDILTGRRRMSAEIAVKIAKATGLSPSQFRPDIFEAVQ